MKLNSEIWKFNIQVKKITTENIEFANKINSFFKLLKKSFNEKNIKLHKIGDFAYNSYNVFNKVLNIDLAALRYFSKINSKPVDLQEEVLNICKDSKIINEIHTDKNYINIIFNFKNIIINFRIISLIFLKKDKTKFYIANGNKNLQEDLAIQLTRDFKYANKLSSGLLFSLKRLINYVMKNEFCYTYNIDILILRWFYEFISKTLENFILNIYINTEKELDIKKFLLVNNFKLWIKKNVKFYDLITFIIHKFNQTNTYYFNSFNFQNEEIFENISRYSINTNSNFKMPLDYLTNINIFDTNDYDQKTYIQNNLSNVEGLSGISWDKFKNEGHRYIVSPLIKTGIANIAMFQKWLTNKSNELYSNLKSELKSEIKSTKQREAMAELNKIANNWLVKYQSKLNYLKPFFDRKYPFVSLYNPEQLASLIVQTIDKIDQSQWIIKNDN
ncbi:hypothetical protein [Spiroplasma taiwanense]|uniref:Uncharacterized protein n=1 Tax=Spiroplasma taiwanense CT-1 TaxID=1276220 RepID=S5MB85_9MOLU|nr:hypothetical protein [Spiroplasma taiwanense]AGR41033.1 hypothetical protein STAIW_v1c03830 [Spiroplasma taiwanense CT-1]